MRLDHVIHTALLSSLTAGCIYHCGPEEVDTGFEQSTTIYEHDVSSYVSAHGAPPDTCEALCEFTMSQYGYTDIERLTITSCTTDVPLPLGADTGAADTGTTDTSPMRDISLGDVNCAGHVVGIYDPACKGGRRPLGHHEQRSEGDSAIGRALADIAHLEAASILAFEDLALWLAQHDAPAIFVARCRAAAEDERAHARIFESLARAHGVAPCLPSRHPIEADLFAVALHNAVEGCVHESWAALEAHWQAHHAEPALRPTFARIAGDETRHGQLAWDLHAWFLRFLSPEQRVIVLAAQRSALNALPGWVALRAEHLGAPAGTRGRALAERFMEGILGS